MMLITNPSHRPYHQESSSSCHFKHLHPSLLPRARMRSKSSKLKMKHRISFQPDPVIDENNNEVDDDNVQPPIRPRRQQLTSSFTLIVVGLVLLFSVIQSSQGLAVNSNKLQRIRALAESIEVAPWMERTSKGASLQQDPEVCLDDGCLDAAFDLLHAVNLTVDPCVDFFEFSCGRWLASNPVPPSASRWSRFNGLRTEVNRITQTILNDRVDINDPRPVNQVKDFYSACKDLDTLESVGLAPVTRLLDQFGGWPMLNPSDWNNATFDPEESIGELRRLLLDDAIISVYIERDLKNTSRNVIFLDQPSFTLPRSVLNNAPSYPAIITAYRTFIVEVAQELGTSESEASLEAAAQAIIDFEIKLANATVSDEDRYDTEAIYHPYLLSEWQALTDELVPGFSMAWTRLLTQVFRSTGIVISPDEQLNVAGEPYLLASLTTFRDEEFKVVADYISWRVASSVIGETTAAMRNITFKFTQALTGAREPESRETACAAASNNNFGMAIGVKYVEAAFDVEAKGLVDALVEKLRISFKELVTEADWMEDPTKLEALAKADAIRSFMAFPEWISNRTAIELYYQNLELATGAEVHFQSVLNLALWSGDKTLSKLRVPTTQDEWLTYPGVVNAFYSPQHNSITFPAGILQPPFFGKTRPASQNYGGIGVVIGHEITHGFDTQGSQFDKDGNAENWWDPITKEKYDEKTQCVVDQYSEFYLPSVDMYVNGDLTQGENIADNGGVRESFKAYRHYVDELGREEGRLPGLEMLTPNQLFFLGYANIWCESITDEGLINQILTDPHSPARFRVIGPMRNNVDFAEAYACPISDDGMNPPEEDKCTVW